MFAICLGLLLAAAALGDRASPVCEGLQRPSGCGGLACTAADQPAPDGAVSRRRRRNSTATLGSPTVLAHHRSAEGVRASYQSPRSAITGIPRGLSLASPRRDEPDRLHTALISSSLGGTAVPRPGPPGRRAWCPGRCPVRWFAAGTGRVQCGPQVRICGTSRRAPGESASGSGCLSSVTSTSAHLADQGDRPIGGRFLRPPRRPRPWPGWPARSIGQPRGRSRPA